ncbi:hypothetical protein [Dyella acidisoli]|uniref:Uncharacterized protein n=1 Tax=Dyella acidisoli TaxID=1867834 RepID=A0ABQ5XTJ2_9GAMM|nr:hypothetical protein [Dyella acidisoli]GLQ95032.1 hypothetical protein GCM10007901_39850 [Dyella acidisoli]
MNAFARVGLLLLALPACATAQTTQDAARISGTIFPTVIRPVPLRAPKPSPGLTPFEVAPGAQGITAVCLTSPDNAAQCRASLDATSSQHAGCTDNAAYDAQQAAMNDAAMYCHGNYEPTFAHAEHIAFCDVEDIGLSRCLARYATAVAKQPAAAVHTLRFTVRDTQGASDTVIVLATATQSDAAIAKAALEGKPGGNIVAMAMP